MSTVINTNLASLYAQNNLTNAQGALAQSVQRLSSGLRINSARDDAAGLSIAQNMQSQINGLSQSVRNLNDATNLLQTADSSLATIQDMLLRLKQLSVQGYDSSLSATQRTNIRTEVSDLNTEINATSTRTKFNGISLLASSTGVDKSLSDLQKGTYLSSGVAYDWAGGDIQLTGDATVDPANGNGDDPLTDSTVNMEVTYDVNSDAYKQMAGVTYTLSYSGDGKNITMSAVSDWSGDNGEDKVYGASQTVSVADVTADNAGADGDVTQTLDFSNFGIKLKVTTSVSDPYTKVLGSSIAHDLDGMTINQASDEDDGTTVKITNIDTSGAIYGAGTYTLSVDSDDEDGTLTTTYTDQWGQDQINKSVFQDAWFDYAGTNTTIDIGFGLKISLQNFQSTTKENVVDWLAAVDNGTYFAPSGTDDSGQLVVTGSGNNKLEFQSGATSSAYITVNTLNVATDSTGTASEMQAVGTSITDTLADLVASDGTAIWQAAFKSLESSIDTALDYISEQRATIGSQMNRLSYIISNLGTQSVNTQNSRSAIIDTDFAAETAKLTKGQIMQQAATAMLAQANQMPNVILSLLK
jgi:flagellin